VILLPELDYNLDAICENLVKRAKIQKSYSIVVVGEGIRKPKGISAATFIAESIKAETGLETRETILGYIQRGGSPTPNDRILATRYGARAAELIANHDFGKMVAKKGEETIAVPLSEVGNKTRLVPKDHPMIKKGRMMGVCFGERN